MAGEGWEVRAREERRGVMVEHREANEHNDSDNGTNLMDKLSI